MNELETQLSELLKKAIEVAEKTGEFAIEQAPLLLQEFYYWHTCKAILGVVFCLTIMFLIHFTIRYIVKLEDAKEIYIFEISQAIPIAGLFVYIYRLVFIIVAPKLYLIEYFINR